MKIAHFTIFLIVLMQSTLCSVAIAQRGLILRPGELKNDRVLIFESRILEVPEEKIPAALVMLGSNDFIALDSHQYEKLLPKSKLDTKSMLEAQAAAADAYAERVEKSAADPFFADRKVQLLESAKEHRAYATYTRRLPTSLRPYLVKAQAYHKGTGRFSVSLREKMLDVSHGSLGQSAPKVQVVPIVVFSERDIASVSVSAQVAR